MDNEEKSHHLSHDEDPELEKDVSKIDESPAPEHATPTKWTFRRVVAVVSLCLVYVGGYNNSMQCVRY